MPRPPAGFEGRPSPDLVQELAGESPEALFPVWERNTRYPEAPFRGGMLPSTVDWPTTWLLPPSTDTYLPPGHPIVSIPDVILETFIGGGRQGLVYSGRVRSSGLIVAIKVLMGDTEETGRRALREAKITSKLLHRNILRVFQVQRAGAFWVVVMEFLQGEDLTRSHLPESIARPCFGQLADAVQVLGASRIVHRDIKPANIIKRFGDQAPVVVDFGLAFDLDEPDESRECICGTPVFMAPEAFSGSIPGNAWDAYSLGMTAVALLLGNRYPRGSSLSTLIEMKVSESFDAEVQGSLASIQDQAIRECAWGLSRKNQRTGW
jgi:serine/threonine protein kinase